MEKRKLGEDPSMRARGEGLSSQPVSLSSLSPELLSPFFHEFRTSLTMIKTCIALLTNPNISYDPTELREFMDIVRRGGDRVDRLVRDFLTVLKLESGVARKEAGEADDIEDIDGAMGAVVQSLHHDIEERSVHVRVEVAKGLPPLPALDEHLQLIVEKLLHNAIKFSKPEGGTVLIRATKGDDIVHFEVTDEGVGIPEEEQERIFDGFYQLVRAGLERQGAGLGLAVARGLVELYGGQIGVRSEVDVGSTFSFYLPIVSRVRRPTPPPEERVPEPAAAPVDEVEEAAHLTAEEAFRRLGITFKEGTEPEPEGEEEEEREEQDRSGLFGRRKKS